jgi:signal transduction histidine kinase
MLAAALRVLVLAPRGDDADRMHSLFERFQIPCTVCEDIKHLRSELAAGAAALLITEESLDDLGIRVFKSVMAEQPSWSTLPVILLTNEIGHARPRTLRMLGSSSAVTFLERPVRIMTLVSTVRAAVTSRQHQYEIRALINKLADATRQRDEFLAMLNHELRNPLAAVRHATEILQHIAVTDPLLSRAREILTRQVAQVTTLLDELLEVERVTSGTIRLHPCVLDVRTVIQAALVATDAELRSKDQSLELHVPDAPVNALGDPVRLEQILVELLENAARCTPAGGSIRVSLSTGDATEIVVADNGVGMEPDVLARVFDLFVQGHRSLDRSMGGLGVGLTLASRLAHMHGGKLEAFSSGVGKGSTFTLRLPVLCARPADDAAAFPDPAAQTAAGSASAKGHEMSVSKA